MKKYFLTYFHKLCQNAKFDFSLNSNNNIRLETRFDGCLISFFLLQKVHFMFFFVSCNPKTVQKIIFKTKHYG